MDFSKTIPHGFFQGVNPWGISCSKGFILHGIPPRNLLLFSPRICRSLPRSNSRMSFPSDAPRNFWEFPLQHHGIISRVVSLQNSRSRIPSVPGLVSSSLILTPEASPPFLTGPAGHGRSFRKRPMESSPGASRDFGHAKPILMEKHRDGLEK